MKIINCPLNGPRPLQEFHYGGQLRPLTLGDEQSDEEWAEYLFCRNGEPGVRKEWWYHIPSGTWFVAERDNCSDEFLATYLYSDSLVDE